MNQQAQSPLNENNPIESPKRQQRRGRRWALAGAAAALVGALSFAGISHANDGAGWHGRHGGWYGDMTNPEAASKRIERMINRLLTDGTESQKTQVAAIAKAALNDLLPLHAQHRAAREQAVKLLTQPTIDRAALEQVRASELQVAEQVSKRLTQALADTAEVLTPEQRVRLAERLKKRMGHAG